MYYCKKSILFSSNNMMHNRYTSMFNFSVKVIYTLEVITTKASVRNCVTKFSSLIISVV